MYSFMVCCTLQKSVETGFISVGAVCAFLTLLTLGNGPDEKTSNGLAAAAEATKLSIEALRTVGLVLFLPQLHHFSHLTPSSDRVLLPVVIGR